jgi:hypothetical protein
MTTSDSENRPHIIYIAGDGRSGSTLLARVLGEIDGFVNLGEAAQHLLNPGMRSRNIACECGLGPEQCTQWASLLNEVDFQVLDAGCETMRVRWFLRLKNHWTRRNENCVEVLGELERFYVNVAAATGNNVLVDSSKYPSAAFLLAQSDIVTTSIIHLVRDPRSVIASWGHAKGYLRKHSSVKSLVQWALLNTYVERLSDSCPRVRTIRYETFTQSPRECVADLMKWMDLPGELPFRSEDSAYLTSQHGLAGNPDRSESGWVTIADRTKEFRGFRSWLIGALLAPWMKRYGYR